MKDCLIQIPLNTPLDYHMSGKFEAPSDDWMHEDFDLTDFELIIMTENVLYIEYNHTPFTVHPNEYLLLPPLAAPGNRRKGLKASNCSFIALHFGYNEKYLSHLFRQLSGMPLKQFILKSKIDEANYLLTDTNLSIGEIAVKLGYTDAHNFARTYKKSTGLSPSAYREAYAKRLLFHV